jgi:hypothetical protein
MSNHTQWTYATMNKQKESEKGRILSINLTEKLLLIYAIVTLIPKQDQLSPFKAELMSSMSVNVLRTPKYRM